MRPESLRNIVAFVAWCARMVLQGGRAYKAWMAFLGALILWGGFAYAGQLRTGLLVTNMRDQVSWAFYIGNFTFLVGVAAAAVLLVIPAYVYNWKPIKEIAIFGELLAISAIIMCLLFVTVDIGRPDRIWHMEQVASVTQAAGPLPATLPGRRLTAWCSQPPPPVTRRRLRVCHDALQRFALYHSQRAFTSCE